MTEEPARTVPVPARCERARVGGGLAGRALAGRRVVVALAVALAVAIPAPGEDGPAAGGVRLAAVFSAHAVLQQDMPVPIWGWADPGATVKVSFAGQSKSAAADGGGRWQVVLDPMPATAEPRPLTVASAVPGDGPVTIPDVLVGEVWLCSGQSNMQWPVQKSAAADDEIAAADFPLIRLFTVAPKVAGEPQRDVKGEWRACSPQTVRDFSAVGYFFGREIHRHRKVPVGLVHASQGWTPSEAWTPREALLGNAETAPIVERWDRICDGSVKGDPNFIHRASGLWNGAVAPLVPCALRGVIWYQGETNERRGFRYRIEFPLLIESWRRAWRRPDLPFLFVQVANVLPPDPEPVDSEWAELRESQALALALPQTGMAVTIDIGEEKSVHPENKQDVGFRLALQARARVYGEDVPHNSPAFASTAIEGDRARLRFTDTYGALKTKDGKPLQGFAIAGADRRYRVARAEIDGDSVVVWSDEVKPPVAVRYAWANNPAGCNLANAADLPAVPFRTDDWPAKTRDARGLVIDDMWK